MSKNRENHDMIEKPRGPRGRLGKDRSPWRRARAEHRRLFKYDRQSGRPFPSFKEWMRSPALVTGEGVAP